MQIITSPKRLASNILRCIDRYNRFAFASAWASAGTPVFDRIIETSKKIKFGVVGIHFFQTDPAVLDAFVGSPKVKFMLQPTGVFHPKTLVFWDENGWEIFIGSANLTKGAFNRNSEMTFHAIGTAGGDTTVRDKALEAIEDWHRQAIVMTADKASEYRATRPARCKALERAAGTYGGDYRKSILDSAISNKSWKDYYAILRDADAEAFDGRIELLRWARSRFAVTPRFSDMAEQDRRAIAGMPSKTVAEPGWFGSMKGAGKFWTALNEHVDELSAALDFIPLDGDVSRRDYDAYVGGYIKAFPDGRHGIATATRLLAMKRPDQFVCFNKENRLGLCDDFGAPKKIGYDLYWDRIVRQIRDAPWWLSKRPSRGSELAAWQGRAAMLDVLFYEPSNGG